MIVCMLCGTPATQLRAERSHFENWTCACRRLMVVRNVTKFAIRAPRINVFVCARNLAGKGNGKERWVISVEVVPKMDVYDPSRVSKTIAGPEEVMEILRDPDRFATCADVLMS